MRKRRSKAKKNRGPISFKDRLREFFTFEMRKGAGVDSTLLIMIIFILAFGTVMIYSASSYYSMEHYSDDKLYLMKQIKVIVVAVVALLSCIWVNYKVILRGAIPLYWFSVFCILLVMTPLGISSHGARRWIGVGSFSFQPAELAKLACILYMARYLTTVDKRELETVRGIVYAMVPSGVLAAMLYVITNNMSSALIVLMISAVMVFVASKNVRIYAIACGAAAVLISAFVYYKLHDDSVGGFRGERIKAWRNPELYADSTAFQTTQALYSIGSGGIMGKGLGQSLQKFKNIPEAQNDMIFSIICEELGLCGAIIVFAMFIVVLYRIYKAANETKDVRASFVCVGVFAHIAAQVILNIAVVTNSIPNTGVTLPFISYGGTSVVLTILEMALVLNVTGQSALAVKERVDGE